MNAVEKEVRELVAKELAAANKRFPRFHSAHEGWAVILEECNEADESMANIHKHLYALWDRIKENVSTNARTGLLRDAAIDTACEAIQIAAMAQKFADMPGDGSV